MKLRVIQSKRKTISLSVGEDGLVIVRAPFRMSDKEIMAFINKNAEWIIEKQKLVQERQSRIEEIPQMTPEELQKLADEAMQYFPEKVRYYAPIVGVTYGRITIRNQKTRWGSCSSKGNLNFNCLLMMAPEEVRDYVIVHELCHRLEMNHSKQFWSNVERVLPDYKQSVAWLKEHGEELMARNC